MRGFCGGKYSALGVFTGGGGGGGGNVGATLGGKYLFCGLAAGRYVLLGFAGGRYSGFGCGGGGGAGAA